MKQIEWRIIVGVVLLVFGGLFLLQSFNVLPSGGWLWSVPFLLAGVAFLIVLFRGKHNWWAVFPGITMLFLGLLILLGEFVPQFTDRYGGTFFLGGLALL